MLSSKPAEVEPAPRRESLDDLAIFGGAPVFGEPRHVGRPNLGDPRRMVEHVGEIFARGWLTNDGPLVKEFEGRVADLAGVEHCVAVSSATVGLQLVARALGFSGEVVVPSFTFIATVHALTWLGFTPVFCDIDRRTHTIDPAALSRVVTPRTSGIVAVHLWGRPCDIDRITDIAAAHGLPLVFDAAHALGCSHRGVPIGGFGDAEVFSFHATKFVNAAEGGAVTTNDGELARRLRLMRNFGFVEYDTVVELGTNAKMSELSAAMGLTSLDAFDVFITANRRNYRCYQRELDDVPGVSLIRYDDAERHNHQYVVLEVTPEAAQKPSRDDLVAVLHAENVLARR
jgi:dTDP-4-amino-4,6-dideoxygalactose transaminase